MGPIHGKEIHTNPPSDLTKCLSDSNCDSGTNSNQTVADPANETKHANEAPGILIFYMLQCSI